MNTTALQSIENTVTFALTCVAQGLEDKQTAKAWLMHAIDQQTQPMHTIVDLPIEVLELLHDELGIGFEMNDGQLSGMRIQTGRRDQITVYIPVNMKGA